MQHDTFFPPHKGVRLADLAQKIGAELGSEADGEVVVRSVSPVARAQAGDICYVLSRRNAGELKDSKASAVLCDNSVKALVPKHIPVLVSENAHTAFALIAGILHPEALRPAVVSAEKAVSPQASVDPGAKLQSNVIVEPFAVIGAGAEIGEGTVIGAGTIIGPGVKIGRDCSIASGATILCSLVGNNVIVHDGARIGKDGFGFAPGPRGMVKIVQIGRVILHDNVEIGANTTIDRGMMDDTVIGEGTKIDNLVQIGHNCRIGRHCAIASQTGLAGSTIIGDGVQIGGQAGLKGHITIGHGAQVGAKSGVLTDIPAGARYAGIPARPINDFMREVALVMKRATGGKKGEGQ